MRNDDDTQEHDRASSTPPDGARWQPPTWPPAVDQPGSGPPTWPPQSDPSVSPPAQPPPPGPGWSAPGAAPPPWPGAQPGPQPGQWTPPGQWAPAGSPSWDAGARHGSSTMAVVAGIVLLVMGIIGGLFGLLFLAVAAAGQQIFEEIDASLPITASAFSAVVTIIAAVLLIFALFQIIGAVGVFAHKGWGRWTGIVVAVIGILLGVLMLLGQFEGAGDAGSLVIVGLWLTAYIVAAYGLAAGGKHFTRRYPGQ